eukprot:2849334-Prorocentrum_lima.AAC.1
MSQQKGTATTKPEQHDDTGKSYSRLILEYCCSDDSKIGQRPLPSGGRKAVRLTETHDMTTKTGIDNAISCTGDSY